MFFLTQISIPGPEDIGIPTAPNSAGDVRLLWKGLDKDGSGITPLQATGKLLRWKWRRDAACYWVLGLGFPHSLVCVCVRGVCRAPDEYGARFVEHRKPCTGETVIAVATATTIPHAGAGSQERRAAGKVPAAVFREAA